MGGVILIIDDKPAVTRMMEDVANLSGMASRVFSKADEALDYFSAHSEKVSLVMTDIATPDMNGLDVVRSIKSMDQLVPVILCTENKAQESAKMVTQLEVCEVIDKPFSVDDMLNKIKSCARY